MLTYSKKVFKKYISIYMSIFVNTKTAYIFGLKDGTHDPDLD